MTVVVLGAGAVGSVIGGRLHQHREAHGLDVVLVARPAHVAAIRDSGLVINDPHGSATIDVPAVERIADVALVDGDVVVLTTKTQDTVAALDELRAHLDARGGADVTIVCAQNGVENERIALRRFVRLQAMCVILPAVFLEPGVVDAFGAPHNAILDLGRYPTGFDETSAALAAALVASGIESRPVAEIMPIKYTKLLLNLGNPIDALVAPGDAAVRLGTLARDEALACYAAAGITAISAEADRTRRQGVMELAEIPGRSRGGGSTWQSLQRGATTTEVDYLNGEIVHLGRLHGVPTPVNTLLCETTRHAAATGLTPRSLDAATLLAELDGVS